MLSGGRWRASGEVTDIDEGMITIENAYVRAGKGAGKKVSG